MPRRFITRAAGILKIRFLLNPPLHQKNFLLDSCGITTNFMKRRNQHQKIRRHSKESAVSDILNADQSMDREECLFRASDGLYAIRFGAACASRSGRGRKAGSQSMRRRLLRSRPFGLMFEHQPLRRIFIRFAASSRQGSTLAEWPNGPSAAFIAAMRQWGWPLPEVCESVSSHQNASQLFCSVEGSE